MSEADRDAGGAADVQAAPVVLYGRPGCHLCDDARAALILAGVGFDEVDIESDDELMLSYLERIPVVTIDGEVAFELFIDAERVRELVRGAAADAD